MKTATLTLGLLLLCFLGFSQENKGNNIEVSIDNVISDQGKVMVSLHTLNTFMKGPGVKNLESTIVNGKVSVTFKNVPEGTYAIMALHDVNENQQMDFESNGMPKESYGLSGNDMSYGPPNFETAKFNVEGNDLKFNIRF